MRQHLRQSFLRLGLFPALTCILSLTGCYPRFPETDGSGYFDKEKIMLDLPGKYHSVLPMSDTEGLCSYYDSCSATTHFLHTSDGFHTLKDCSELSEDVVYMRHYQGTVYAVTSDLNVKYDWETRMYKSDDCGKSWKKVLDTLNFSVQSFDISKDGVLCISDFGSESLTRILLSYDQGENWAEPGIKVNKCAMNSDGLLFYDFRTGYDDIYHYDFRTGKVTDIPWFKFYGVLRVSDDLIWLNNKLDFMEYDNGRVKMMGRLGGRHIFSGPLQNCFYKNGSLVYASVVDEYFSKNGPEHIYFFSDDGGRRWQRLGGESNGFREEWHMWGHEKWAGYKDNLYYMIKDTLYIARPKFKVEKVSRR